MTNEEILRHDLIEYLTKRLGPKDQDVWNQCNTELLEQIADDLRWEEHYSQLRKHNEGYLMILEKFGFKHSNVN